MLSYNQGSNRELTSAQYRIYISTVQDLETRRSGISRGYEYCSQGGTSHQVTAHEHSSQAGRSCQQITSNVIKEEGHVTSSGIKKEGHVSRVGAPAPSREVMSVKSNATQHRGYKRTEQAMWHGDCTSTVVQ